MKLVKRFFNALRAFNYEAVEPRATRRPVYISSRSEDGELTPAKRRALISEARDQLRNFSLAGFALRKHLQFVAYYQFYAATPSSELNDRLERLVAEWMRPANCDAARRRSFPELINLAESHRAIDGDVFFLKTTSGALQIIEGDRVKNPPDVAPVDVGKWVHGVKIDAMGRPRAYAIWSRSPGGGMEFERVVNADKICALSYVTRADQVRGVSLFAPAVKMIAYLYDGLDYALAKLKLEQLLGLKTTLEDGGNLTYTEATTDSAESVAAKTREIFGRDVMHLALKVGEDAEFMESSNPSQNFQSFCENVLRMIFAALDIPYSFYDGSKTNFYGSRGEFEQYLDSVEAKQKPTIYILEELTRRWLLPLWIAAGSVEIPRGISFDEVANGIGWRGAGYPSWRMYDYIKEITLAMSAGLVSPSAVAASFNEDMRKNIEEIGAVRADAARAGVALPFGGETANNIGL